MSGNRASKAALRLVECKGYGAILGELVQGFKEQEISSRIAIEVQQWLSERLDELGDTTTDLAGFSRL